MKTLCSVSGKSAFNFEKSRKFPLPAILFEDSFCSLLEVWFLLALWLKHIFNDAGEILVTDIDISGKSL
jgi:hypothetical protein